MERRRAARRRGHHGDCTACGTVQNPPVRTVANLKLTGPITVRIGEQIVLQTDRQ